MKTGRSLTELAQEVERQALSRRDFVADTRELTMLNGDEVSITGQGEFHVNALGHDQLGRYLDIPSKFYDRIRAQHPTLLDHNVNTLLRANPKKRLVRTLDGDMRAFLSDRYRRLDNDELMQVILPELAEIPDVEFPSCEITPTRLYIRAFCPRMTADIKVGDTVRAGVMIKNSEVGMGSLTIQGIIERLICTNGMVTDVVARKYHVGRQIETGDDAMEIFADETLRADDNAFWLKVRDMVRGAVTESQFQRVVEKLRGATETSRIEDPSAGVRELTKRLALTEDEGKSVLRHLATGGDLSKYGAVQAITRAAQDVESFDRSVELETVGGQLLEFTPAAWREVATATA